MSEETYWKLQMEHDDVDTEAAFTDESRAKGIAGRFNERYNSDYEVVQSDEATAEELYRGTVMSAVEAL